MQEVLITGATGFLGKRLTAYLRGKDVNVTALGSKDVDLCSTAAIHQIPVKPYDHIFHLAAWTQAGTFCDVRRGEQWIINQQLNTNMLAWWQANCAKAKMITFGTSVSYASEHDLVETKYMDGQPYDKFYAYAMCKRMLLTGLECLNKQFGMNYLYLIPSTIYGANYHTDERQKHFIYDLVQKIIRGKLYDEPVVLWGDGEQRRELIFIDNFIDIMLALNKVSQNDIFNLGGGIDYSIKDFAQVICAQVGYDFHKIEYDTAQYVGAKSKILNVEKYRTFVPTSTVPIEPLDRGIAETIAWFYSEKDRFLRQ
jgi:GDP-L-fucose synthase